MEPIPEEVEPILEEPAWAAGAVPPRAAYTGKGNRPGMHAERDAENRAMAWAAQHFEKHKEAWRKPPDGSIKSDVPFACRFLYQQAATDLLSGIVGAPNDARRWYVYLRLFPELVLRDTQRSGRSASNEISRRLHLWRQFQWAQLYNECRTPSKNKPNGPDPGLENDGDGALRRAA